MKIATATIANVFLITIAITFSACYSTGLSNHEQIHFDYGNLVYSIYNENQAHTPHEQIKFPLSIGISQVGESSAPKEMIRFLETQTDTFKRVSSIPSIKNQKDLSQMFRMAKDLDLEYIFIFGGSLNTTETQEWYNFLDLTILGAWLIPSTELSTTANASGVLIQVKTQQATLIASAEDENTNHTTTVALPGTKEKHHLTIKNTLVQKLSTDLLYKLRLKQLEQAV